jgi:REP element-mobilizing transposase RayT
MRRNKLELYLHLVWATWDRLPLIDSDLERRLHRMMISMAQAQDCDVLAMNGMPDHVHLVVRLPATISIADLAKQIKGTSSRFVNETAKPEAFFKWQGSYGAFTMSRWDVERIVNYVDQQKEHHHAGELFPEWEECFEEDLPT